MKNKVLLGLSGGVDSAIAAYKLKEQGYDVTCAFMRNWDALANNDIQGNSTIMDKICPQEADYEDAKQVAEKLDLPLLRIDFVKEYWDYVFSSFLSEYEKGRTPNPDILCNKYIKFDQFLQYAKKHNYDYVATGHYAQVDHQGDESILLRGADENKDQTYFLCQISQDALAHTLFPIGNMTKQEVRIIAKQLDLNIAEKKDSTGICFIGERNFKAFLQNYLPAKSGNIIDVDTKTILGQHTGVLYYTIGQRKGLGIGGKGGPWFVVGKNIEKKELYVASGENHPLLFSTSCLLTNVNWFTKKKIPRHFKCSAKFRYRQKDHDVEVEIFDNDIVKVKYPQGISSVTVGQETVFYDCDMCLGGGVIDSVYKDEQDLNLLVRGNYEN
ncbi:MAG: tRNA 2-thiouridine(34) synthase MnmA [Breznakia sp.]